ncbi:MAG TPA: ABC transporter ATP-binding protein [Methanospirillum sp.]|uniref:ABC transporter ATP-binding protein n=1 Tax=Methanospirillum sp. TaxID=45200 RepID=UPI002CC55688|nr:ABC transporter ATP-binding protein [Methanospirillum sp.]HWQ65172.1 ABC transporter ATP-binding protein [Methanospirillum sp.]
MMCARLEVKNAAFSYDGKRNIFENISFSVDSGDVFCILGPNGTGKSTLLRCLCNLYPLNAGSIYIDGKDISSYAPKKLAKKIGFIPQIHTPTFPYSVLQVVMMGRTPHLNTFASPSHRDREIALEALRTVNIEHIRDRPYTELSGGQMQLVLMARVLAQEPEILLLDEPTSHLDVGNQIYTIKMIRKLSQKGLALVMTSHFPDHTFLSSSKVGIMKDRKFLAMGPAEVVVTEKNLQEAYGVPIKIISMDGEIKRKIAVPVVKD